MGAKSFVLGSSSGMGFLSGPDLAKIGFRVIKAEELFNKIAAKFYFRFEREAVITSGVFGELVLPLD